MGLAGRGKEHVQSSEGCVWETERKSLCLDLKSQEGGAASVAAEGWRRSDSEGLPKPWDVDRLYFMLKAVTSH